MNQFAKAALGELKALLRFIPAVSLLVPNDAIDLAGSKAGGLVSGEQTTQNCLVVQLGARHFAKIVRCDNLQHSVGSLIHS